jgi:hypothetical protein
LRGGLVGACSALVAAAAHSSVGDSAPSGGALVIAVLICLIVGAAVGDLALQDRRRRLVAVVSALCSAQVLCHLLLVATGHHHQAADGLGLSPAMLAAHAGAAVTLGGAICASEYLYVVCVSVLCWLRLFAARGPRPSHRHTRRITSAASVRDTYLCSGLGMRAPPRGFVAAA